MRSLAQPLITPEARCIVQHQQRTVRSVFSKLYKDHQQQTRDRTGVAVPAATSPSSTTTVQDALVNGSSTHSTSYSSIPTSSQAPPDLLDGFQWQSHWYPVQVSATTDPSKPHAIELLGMQLVLWRDAAGQWHCMEDACPHRLAPLSEGRLEPSDGTLQCSYHGWRFNGSGQCVEIPQALDDKAKAVACSSSRSCVTSYSVQEAYGLIWVWPSAGPAAAAAAAAAPLPVSKGLVQTWDSKPGGHHKWYRRELPYSFDMLIENLADPSHLPFSHHKLTPVMLRERASSMPFSQLEVPAGSSSEEAQARPSFSFAHKAPLAAFSFPSVLSPSGRVSFSPPSCVVYQYELGPYTLQNDLLAVPAGPGRSVAYTLGMSDAPQVTNGMLLQALFTNPKQLMPLMFRAKFQRRPLYQEHLGMNKLFDQDNVFLNMQDRLLAQRGKSAWSKDYYMPAPCDGLVATVRRWADAAYQLPLPGRSSSSSGSSTAGSVMSLSAATAAGPRLSPQQLNDRLRQHTQHCTVCSKSLAGLKSKLQRAQIAAAAAFAGLLGLVGSVVLPYLAAALLGVQQPAAGAAGAAAAAGSSSLGAVGIAAALVAVVAVVAMAVAKSTAALIQQFEYVDFSHADNH